MNNQSLYTLGFDEWFEAQAEATLCPGQSLARVMTVDRGAYVVQTENGESYAEVSGRFRYEVESSTDLPCVGDWVCIESASPEMSIVQSVLPRKSFLGRKTPGRTIDFQLVATNLDVGFIVQSCHYDFNIRRLDRYLVAANEGGIEPVIILSKTDLVSPEELSGMLDTLRRNGIENPIFPLSNTTGAGVDEFRETLLPRKTYCLLGSSGVGKTTLMNRLLGEEVLDTKAVSQTGEGVHTTSRRQLLMLGNGAMLIDTPGMRELGLLGAQEGIEDSFSDIRELACTCRFTDCSHTQEPGCAVRMALETGELCEDRLKSYRKLMKETEYHDMSYVEKRNKDKSFGKFIKSVKKDLRRRR